MKYLYKKAINDSKETVTMIIDGKQVMCPFYVVWRGVIRRSLCEKEKKRMPSYLDVSICDEWLLFSNFKDWMIRQDWVGKYLDKDLLKKGNKIYCPEFCVFIDHKLNTAINTQENNKNGLSKGVHFDKERNKFSSQISIDGKSTSLGRFNSEIEASDAYKKARKKKLTALSVLYSDKRISKAILSHIEIVGDL